MISRSFFRYIFRYSQQEAKKNVFILPNRNFIRFDVRDAIQTFTKASRTCKEIAVLLRDNISHVSDITLTDMYCHMAEHQLQLDQNFDTIISPITQQYLKAFTRSNSYALGKIAISCASLKVQNPALWESLFKKLDQQGLYRNMTLIDTLMLLDFMLDHGVYANHSLISKLQKVIYEQKAYYGHYPQLLKRVKSTINKMQKLPKKEEHKLLEQAYKQLV